MMVIAFNFKTRLPLIYAIATSGIGTGLTAFAPLFQLAYNYYGHASFFLVLAGLSMQIIVFGVVCAPSKMETSLQEQRKKGGRGTKAATLTVLKNKGIICLCVSFFSFGVGLYTINLHLPKYITLQGFTHIQAASILSIIGGGSVIGRLMTGLLSNFKIVNITVLYANSMFMVAAATFVYPYISTTLTGQIVFASIVGCFYSTCFVLITPCTKQFVALVNVPAAFGLQFMFGGIGAIIGPVFAGKFVFCLFLFSKLK